MKFIGALMLILAAMVVVGKTVAMLPPETFHDPIFVAEGGSNDDGADSREYTEFA